MAGSIEIKGLAKLEAKLTTMQKLDRLRPAMNKAVLLVESEAKNTVAVDTGALRLSINPSVEVESGTKVVGKVSTSLEYAPHVEYGTSKTRAQPFLFPALRKNEKRIKKLFADTVIKTVVEGK